MRDFKPLRDSHNGPRREFCNRPCLMTAKIANCTKKNGLILHGNLLRGFPYYYPYHSKKPA
jgi:hypothetical protein